MAKKLRRSYLNDYQPGMNGEYYYTGRHMGLEGTLAQRSDLNKKIADTGSTYTYEHLNKIGARY